MSPSSTAARQGNFVAASPKSGSLYVLVGPGGVGKNTLMRYALAHLNNLSQLATATTRPMRPGEQHNRERLFLTLEQFQEMIRQNELIEHQEVTPGLFYGVPRQSVDVAIAAGIDLIADIEVFGAMILRREYPQNAVLIFVAPPSMESLAARMRERGTDETIIADRMERAQIEMTYAPVCQSLIVNDDLDAAARELCGLIQSRRDYTSGPLLRFQPEFEARVTIIHNDAVLRRAADDDLRERVLPGELPFASALRLLAGFPNLQRDAGRLRVDARPGAPPDSAVEITYQADPPLYRLIYHFQYQLDTPIEAPDGWTWLTGAYTDTLR
jgi:guanylate kinase